MLRDGANVYFQTRSMAQSAHLGQAISELSGIEDIVITMCRD